MASRSTLRLAKEYRNLQVSGDLSLAVACRDDDIHTLRTLIVGPPDTPYQFGFFEFDFRFTDAYPSKPPEVKARTTNGSRTRFNPNIYADGKVCLSILGTWAAGRGESWSTAQGLESTLISIQSLMCANPYENEPGHERDETSKAQKAYADKIRHETIRITICQRLEYALGIVERPQEHPTPWKSDVKPYGAFNDVMGLGGYGIDEDSLEDDEDDPDAEADVDEHDESDDHADESSHGLEPTNKKAKVADGSAISTSTAVLNKDAATSSAKVTTTNPWMSKPYMPIQISRQPPRPPPPMETSAEYDPFVDLCKHRFLWYYDSYVATIDTEAPLHPQREHFDNAPFEGGGNSCRGLFDYPDLLSRIKRIRQAIDDETASWGNMHHTSMESATRTSLLYRLDEAVLLSRQGTAGRFDVAMVQDNPLIWQMTLFGSSSALDGSIIAISINFPPNFPQTQPRVSVSTPLFHHRISPSGGVLCYSAADADNPVSHVKGIIEALQEDDPRYDPRTLVHPEAAKLLWGDEQQKKTYRRRLRRSVQDSLEAS